MMEGTTSARSPSEPQPSAPKEGMKTNAARQNHGAAAPGSTKPTGKTLQLSQEEYDRLTQQAKQAQDEYVRAVAEFDNTKKRLHREKEEFAKYAAESLVRELLPILDSLDQALVAVDKQSDPQSVIKGVHLIYRQLLGLLNKEGVARIPTVGEPFDPHRHEAVAQVDAQDGVKDQTVVEEVQVGYTMHGKIIRPAMVKVAKKSSPPSTVDSPRTIEENKEEAKE